MDLGGNPALGIILIGLALGLPSILTSFEIMLGSSVLLILQMGFILWGLAMVINDG